jgi:hypothetical protein
MAERSIYVTCALILTLCVPAAAQYPPGKQSSPNIHVLSHLPLGQGFTTLDVEVEPELSRPYAYASRMHG